MEEKKISYSLIELSRDKDENLQAEFLKVNPFGKLPVTYRFKLSNAKRRTT